MLFEEELNKKIEIKSSRDQRKERASGGGSFRQAAVDVQYEQDGERGCVLIHVTPPINRPPARPRNRPGPPECTAVSSLTHPSHTYSHSNERQKHDGKRSFIA